jgi:hypothetical protein
LHYLSNSFRFTKDLSPQPGAAALQQAKTGLAATPGCGPQFCLLDIPSGKHKVLPAYSRAALPIHAKSGREWEPRKRALAYGRQDDELNFDLESGDAK